MESTRGALPQEPFSFWDVEGVPVWIRPVAFAEAFDTMPPRRFPYASVERNGIRLTGPEFMAMCAQTYGRDAAAPLNWGQAFADNLNRNVLFEEAGLIPPPP